MVRPVMRPFPQFALVLLALTVGFGGCGGDDSADEYREQASALCVEAIREAERATPPAGRGDWDGFLQETLELARDYTRRLEELDPPEELAGMHEQMTRLNERARRLTEQLRDDLAAGRPLRELLPEFGQELLSIARRDNRLAREMDLPECVTPLPAPGGAVPAPA
jgi:hypothetical protein